VPHADIAAFNVDDDDSSMIRFRVPIVFHVTGQIAEATAVAREISLLSNGESVHLFHSFIIQFFLSQGLRENS
jgi:hypothetical protein